MTERLSTGVPEIDKLIAGGIPKGFLVAAVGEPGTGKTIFCIHFIWEGIRRGDACIYVTTEESKESVIAQASQFGMDFERAIDENKLIVIDALMKRRTDRWSLLQLDVEELVSKVIEAKRELGSYDWARLVIDSMSAFWLDKPAMARKYSYYVKKMLSQWKFTTIATSQYAITTSDAFGFGIEHVADGIIRFRRAIRGGRLRRYIAVEKMRQTPHDPYLYEIDVVDGRGLVVLGRAVRREEYALPHEVKEKIVEAKKRKEKEIP